MKFAKYAVFLSFAATFSAGAAEPTAPLAPEVGQPTSAADARVAKPANDNRQMTMTENEEGERTPFDAAEEDYANRAYPGVDVPFQATQAAQTAFKRVKGRGVGKGKKVPGQWTMVGPSTANFPATLTFSGADYTTSGRITALAISPNCTTTSCRMWVAAAGGGVWRTDNALSGSGPSWTYVSGSFATNAIGTLTYDAAHNTLYAGTGEPNASGDSEAGYGIYKSTDGGNTWSLLPATVTALTTSGNGTYTGGAFNGRSISGIAIDPTNPNVMWVGSARGVRGVAETGGATSNPPLARPPFGLFMSTDGGNTFTFVWDGAPGIRGVTHVELDPNDHTRIYASAFQAGIWRSTGGGAFEKVFATSLPGNNTNRTEFALTSTGGHTRIYAGDGGTGGSSTGFWRVDNADIAAASLTSGGVNVGWTSLTSSNLADPHVATYNYCTGQCWYDSYVFTPPGHPDIVYLGGSYNYGELYYWSNTRAVLLSTDAGEHFTDMTWDASSDTAANGIHPDQHALVVNPNNPLMFFSASDGGLMRSSGTFTDKSSLCSLADASLGGRGLSGNLLTACSQVLSRIPSHLYSLNKGLSTLQFQSVSANPTNYKNLIGGTQDNGTFQTTGSYVVWPQVMYGDGGNSGFDASSGAMINTFTGQAHDANFQAGAPDKWVVIGGPIRSGPESALFYPPVLTDPAVSGTIFEGSQGVWRTQDFGGNQAYLEANCAEFTTSSANPACGDFVRLGPTTLTTSALGGRSGGNVAALARGKGDSSTLWAATTAGRVFVSKNVDNPTASAVSFTRIDTLAANAPNRTVNKIVVDPTNPNHAWIAYGGYNFNTPALQGHIFSVVFDPIGGTATYTPVDYDLFMPPGTTFPNTVQDFPITSVAYDDVTGDLYAASDFGVTRLPFGATSWVLGGTGLPSVEVSSLTIVPGARTLYAATHGRSAWKLQLP
jgi:hypothetical protein